MKVGYVGSLTGFAGNYGSSVLEGAQLAADEIRAGGGRLELIVEDDASAMKQTSAAYQKLRSLHHIDALIGGSWWANGLVHVTAQDGIPFLSCETLYNDDAVLAPNYFLMEGDLRTWVRIYEPLIRQRGWKKGATIRFTSGFGATIAREMQSLFEQPGRSYAGTIEYNDVLATDAAAIAVQVRKLSPDVVYLDGQPGSIANILRKFREQGLASKVAVLTHAAGEDMIKDSLIPAKDVGELYVTRKASYREDFVEKFRAKYGREPRLDADLGYYSLLALDAAMKTPDPIACIRSGALTVGGLRIEFDEHNAYLGAVQDVWALRNGAFIRIP